MFVGLADALDALGAGKPAFYFSSVFIVSFLGLWVVLVCAVDWSLDHGT